METSEAADLIDAIANAIRSEPNQFLFEVNVTGQHVVASAPGSTGLSISVSGMGNTGQVVGIDAGAAVQIAQKAEDAAARQWAEAATRALGDLSAALRQPQPDKSVIRELLARAGAVIGKSAIQASVAFAVTAALAAL